jgi:hypothetical protein
MASEEYIAARERREQEWSCLVESYNQLTKELKSEWDCINKGHQDLEAEKKTLCQENGGVSVSDSDILDINAGGEIIRVSRGTLTQIKGTVLDAIFSGRWEKMLLRDGNGNIFLDVNPECFRCIVDYLTECKIASPEHPPRPPTTDDDHRESFQRLCKVFGLSHQMEIPDSVILKDPNHVSAISGFLTEDGLGGSTTLLYRATRDGFISSSFLERCEGWSHTLTVIETTNGYVFGGYSDQPWWKHDSRPNNGSFIASDKDFLFGLKCYASDQPEKLRIKESQRHEALNQCNGLAFGRCDLQFLPWGSSSLGESYELPTGWNANSFTGSGLFTMKNVETFSVNPFGYAKRRKLSHFQNASLNDFTSDPFPKQIKECFEREKQALLKAFTNLAELKDDFEHERDAVQLFCKREGDKIVRLNVSGRIMNVKNRTLSAVSDSVLYKHFVDQNGSRSTKRKLHPVREWTSNDVCQWVGSLNCSADICSLFSNMTGTELLSLDVIYIKELGIDRPGTVSLLEKSIQKLRENEEENAVVFVEHSSYCIGKILDQLRLKNLVKLGFPEPTPPKIRNADKERFRRIVEYFFPSQELASIFLG